MLTVACVAVVLAAVVVTDTGEVVVAMAGAEEVVATAGIEPVYVANITGWVCCGSFGSLLSLKGSFSSAYVGKVIAALVE